VSRSPPVPFVRTVTGDLAPGQLGRTDYHEHLFQASPLLAGDELDDLELAARETSELHAAGIETLVDLTPIGLGRNPAGLREISARTGVRIVAATGVHREAHYPAGHWVRDLGEAALAKRFEHELRDGIAAADPSAEVASSGVRAGVIKVGIGYWSISPFERRVLAATGAAHRATGAPVVCHLEMGTAAFEAASALEAAGVRRDKLVLAHVDRNPDPGLHLELAASGVYLGYDGAGRAKYWPDSILIDCLVAVAAGGGSDRLLLGGDVARRSSFTAYGGLPGMAYLPRRFVPRLRAAGGEELVSAVLVANPARAFSWA
jgi:predicted metal-dependent phosphotriesterase family hydrolase